MAGSAIAIGANARGEVWIIEKPQRAREPQIYRLRGRIWQPVPGAGVRIAVDPAGNAWVVESSGAIRHYTGAAWEQIPGDAIDIAVGNNGAVWIIGRDQSISHLVITAAEKKPTAPSRERGWGPPTTPAKQYRWEKVEGSGVRIAVDPEGEPWVVNSAGQIYHYKGNTRISFPGSAKDIAVGPDGVVYVVGTTPSSGGFEIMRSQGSTWVIDGIAGEIIAAGAAGVVYVAKDAAAGNALAERVANRLTAGSPPTLSPALVVAQKPATGASSGTAKTQPPVNAGLVQPVGTPSNQQPSVTQPGVRSIQPGASTAAQPASTGTAATQPTSTTTQATGQGSSQVPIPLQSATIEIPPTPNPGAVSIKAPNQPVVINPPTITPPAGTSASTQSSSNSGPVVVTPPNITPSQQPISSSSMTVAPAGTVTIPSGTITLNQPAGGIPIGSLNPAGPPPGGPTGSSVTTGSLVLPGSSAATPKPPSNTPLQVTGLGYTPIVAPAGSFTLLPGAQYVHAPGKLLCSDPEAMGICHNVDAGYVGAYTLNTSCSSGFYDLINGGTCWKAPDDDGHGAWERSADPVNSDTAFWRDALSSAVWDKYGMSWDCSGNQFWDAQDQSGNIHGSCWHCPSDYPDRWMSAVWSSTACRSHQTRPATFIGYNGCPKPDKTTMYPNDQRRPGEPFLDIASGLSVANNAGGACWACPVSDEQGNYLYTERNANTLISRKTGNNGCTVGFRYTPGRFVEPGLSGLPGVKDILAQEQVFQRPNALTTYLFAIAAKQKLSGAQATQWVASQWADIAAHPYQNANVRALIYQYMIGHAPAYMYASGTPTSSTALACAPASGTAASGTAEEKLVCAFQQYIQARRTHAAQEALDMYYAWKQNVGVTRSLHAESELQTLFYYGTVPLDFSSIVAAVMVPTSTGVAVLTATWAAEAFQANIAVTKFGTVARAMTLFQAFDSFDAFSALPLLAQIDIISGPVGIAFAGATMAAMAIGQVVQIATAEQNLKDARDKAKNTTIDLFALYNGTNGSDQVAMYWADATGLTTEHEDPQVLAAAQSAYAAAQQSNFAQLPTNTPNPNAISPASQQLSQQTASQQTYAQFMNASATLLQQLRRVTDGPSAKAGQAAIQNAMTTYNQAKARLPGANLGSDQRNAANSATQQVNAEITRIKGIPAANQVLADTFATSRYHGTD